MVAPMAAASIAPALVRAGLRFECQPDCGACCTRHGDYAYIYLHRGRLARAWPRRPRSVPRPTSGALTRASTTATRVLRMDEPACPFLDGTRCSVYAARPGAVPHVPLLEREPALAAGAGASWAASAPGSIAGASIPARHPRPRAERREALMMRAAGCPAARRWRSPRLRPGRAAPRRRAAGAARGGTARPGQHLRRRFVERVPLRARPSPPTSVRRIFLWLAREQVGTPGAAGDLRAASSPSRGALRRRPRPDLPPARGDLERRRAHHRRRRTLHLGGRRRRPTCRGRRPQSKRHIRGRRGRRPADGRPSISTGATPSSSPTRSRADPARHVFGSVPFASGRTHDWSTLRIGSGPFVLESHRPGKRSCSPATRATSGRAPARRSRRRAHRPRHRRT